MRAVLGRLAHVLATGAFSGYCPIAPGTAGSAVGLLLDRGLQAALVPGIRAVVIVSLSVVGGWAAHLVEKESGRKDPSIVVIDEICGMMVGVFLLPVGFPGAIAAFLVFRVLDIIKPFPCRRAERLPGGAGIMADDLIAGVYTNVLIRIASVWWPSLRV